MFRAGCCGNRTARTASRACAQYIDGCSTWAPARAAGVRQFDHFTRELQSQGRGAAPRQESGESGTELSERAGIVSAEAAGDGHL